MSRPDLAALDVDRLTTIPAEELPAVLAALAAELARLAALEAAVAARLATSASSANGHGGDRLLTVDDAAERLGVTRDWLRRRTELPFVVKLSDGVTRYSGRGIDDYIATRRGVASHT